MKIRLYFSLFILINTLFLKAQDCDQKATGNLKTADGYFSWQRYPCALKEYLLIYKKKPDNKKVNRKIAQCYLNSPGANKSLAINYLDFLIKAGKTEKEVFFEMGQALMYNQDFDRSIEYLNKYLELTKPGKEALKIGIGTARR